MPEKPTTRTEKGSGWAIVSKAGALIKGEEIVVYRTKWYAQLYTLPEDGERVVRCEVVFEVPDE